MVLWERCYYHLYFVNDSIVPHGYEVACTVRGQEAQPDEKSSVPAMLSPLCCMTLHYAKCKGITRTKENALVHEGPIIDWGNKNTTYIYLRNDILQAIKSKVPRAMRTGRKETCCRIWQKHSKGELDSEEKGLTWIKVNQMSNLEPLCGKPGGSWTRDDITELCFRQLLWQQGSALSMGW